jgi:hypothetical protein
MRRLLAWFRDTQELGLVLDPVTLRHGEEYTARECLSQPGRVSRVDAETVARERLFAARERIAARMGG